MPLTGVGACDDDRLSGEDGATSTDTLLHPQVEVQRRDADYQHSGGDFHCRHAQRQSMPL